jgi:Nif-specific regulatory protein
VVRPRAYGYFRGSRYDAFRFPHEMITLEVLQGQATGAVFELDQPAITIGRSPSNQGVLADYHLSGEHGPIFREDDQYIYRDLRSTNGSRIRRGDTEIVLDGGERAEAALRDGDQILLGDRNEAVILACRVKVGETAAGPMERLLAKRELQDADAVAAEVERDPALGRALYEVSKKLGRRGLDLQAVFDGIAEAVFELVPKATHLAIDLADEADGRFNTVYARAREGQAAGGEPVRTSRAVVRRVTRERAALLVADAPTELGGTESIMGAKILSTIGVPLWEGETIRGVIQADNRASAGMFRERDLELLLVLAGQSTLAIENARLFKKLQIAEERLRGENRYLKTREEKRRFADIIGESDAMRDVFRQLEKVIDTRATVCIEGETGTGKELIASAIHYQGGRRDKLFVAQNCAAVPENLLESELFGHKKGSFTGADHDKKGLFEIADGGTLFLDEIGEMTLGLQAKLLRVLQEGEVRPVGATSAKKVDVRIICATNRALEKEVERGTFRQDLYYRLKVFPLRLPPLRERREDIPILVEHFLRKYTAEMKKPVAGITPEALDQMAAYGWPGNIRELENEVQRLVIQSEPESFVTPDLLSPQIRKIEGLLGRIAPKKGTLKDMMEEVERWLLAEALREHGGNKTKTAETLGITREGLHKKLAKYGM